MKWLIVYSDRSTFSSDDGEYYEAPVGGVEIVYNSDPIQTFLISDSRYGYWGWREESGWVGFHTESGYWDYMFQSGILKYVLYGRTLPTPEFHELRKEAAEKALNLKKNGWWEIERRLEAP